MGVATMSAGVDSNPLLEMEGGAVTISVKDVDRADNASGISPVVTALAMSVIYFGVGIVFYTTVGEVGGDKGEWPILEALYFCVVTITTVGYGDTNDHDFFRRDDQILLFTSAYVFFGVAIVGTCIGIILGWIIDYDEDRRSAIADEVAAEYMGEGAVTPHCGPAANGGSRLGMTVFTLVALIAAGTFAFKEIEHVTTVRALYWCCVTITTVGYGDVVPVTNNGKMFAIAYILIGTFLMAKALADIAALPLELRRKRQEASVLNQYGSTLQPKNLQAIASDTQLSNLGLSRQNNAGCSKSEFVLSMLLKLDKIKERDVRRCASVFDSLDANQDGYLNESDVQQ